VPLQVVEEVIGHAATKVGEATTLAALASHAVSRAAELTPAQIRALTVSFAQLVSPKGAMR